MNDGPATVVIRGLAKRFGRRQAVWPLDLDVPRGSVFGLLGHNGAGKSTVLGMMLGQVFPDAGRIEIEGHDVFAERHAALGSVGAIFETPCFYDYLSGWSNLRILAAFSSGVSEQHMRDAVARVGLTSRIDDVVGAYSHGMRQRLALAQALVHRPRMLILDEPSDGLDPEAILETRSVIQSLNRDEGMTILFSSHQLHEVEQVCTHLAVMREGRLLFAGPWNDAIRGSDWLELDVSDWGRASLALRDAGLVCDVLPGEVRCASRVDAAGVNRYLVEHGFAVRAIGPRRQSLESFYMQIVRQGAMSDDDPRDSQTHSAACVERGREG